MGIDFALFEEEVIAQPQTGVDLGTETAPAGGNVVIDAVKGKSPQPGVVVAFRTRGKTEQNMIDALLEDDAVGNPFGPFAAIKTDDVGEAVTRFLNWLEGTGDSNVMQNYRKYLLEIAPDLKGKTIFYYKDLGRPSHATALDYFLNGPIEQQQATQPALEQPAQASMTVGYTPQGKQRQMYTVQGTQIFNKDGKEVFKTASADRNKIFANLAVKQGRAKIVTHKGADYVVNDRLDILSVKTGKIMKWGPENGDRKAIINLYQGVEEVTTDEVVAKVSEQKVKKDKITINDLNEGQRKAYDDIVDFLSKPGGNTHSLIGYAGTGKTTLLNLVREYINKELPFDEVMFTSPTHRANAVMKLSMPDASVKTLHSLLNLSPQQNLDKYDARTAEFVRQGRGGAKPSILVIDESSMINDQLYELITKEFSDSKVLFVGDDAQLKPVKQAVTSKALSSTNGISVLNEVMRADNNSLLKESMHVRNTGTFNTNSNDRQRCSVYTIKQRL